MRSLSLFDRFRDYLSFTGEIAILVAGMISCGSVLELRDYIHLHHQFFEMKG